MQTDPTRRAFLAGATATAAAAGIGARAARATDDTTSLPYRTAGELVKMLADKKISARELLDAAIARIEALDARINAVVVRDFDRARAAAAEADAALGRGERKPLLGLPMTIKEQFGIAGLPTTWGFPKFRDWKAEVDALAVQRLKTAGAVIIGKTNVPMRLGDWQSYNDIYGTTNNPWNLERSPGGSSGGSAAALAAGFVPLELGSDIGGSLRAPAHFCGVFSHKPSLDLIPQRGGGPPRTPAIPLRGDLSVHGPLARSAADLALELDVLAGPDELMEGIGYKLALPAPRHDKLADYRVLVIDKHPLCPTAQSITDALNDMADRLGKAGCTILRGSAKLPDLAQTGRVYRYLLSAGYAADFSPEDIARGQTFLKELGADDHSLRATGLRGITTGHPDWIRQSRIRNGLRARWQALFRDVDVVICPPMPSLAFPHDHSQPQYFRTLDVDGTKIPYNDQSVWAGPATLTGLPSTTMPIARSPEGLPIGMQIMGGFLDDRTTIAFAGLVEREFGGFTPPPNFA